MLKKGTVLTIQNSISKFKCKLISDYNYFSFANVNNLMNGVFECKCPTRVFFETDMNFYENIKANGELTIWFETKSVKSV